MWALVRITPLLSIRTPLPEMGLNKPPVLEVQIMLTIAVRTFSLSSLKFVDSIGSAGGRGVITGTTGLLIVGAIVFFFSGTNFRVVVETDFSVIIDDVATGG